jgi:hypothetical protein
VSALTTTEASRLPVLRASLALTPNSAALVLNPGTMVSSSQCVLILIKRLFKFLKKTLHSFNRTRRRDARQEEEISECAMVIGASAELTSEKHLPSG